MTSTFSSPQRNPSPMILWQRNFAREALIFRGMIGIDFGVPHPRDH
jgi:hypothetical protein